MKTINLFLIILLGLLLWQCKSNESFESKRNQDFNEGWLFMEDSTIVASTSEFDDTDWRTVDLPHDWSVEDYAVQDSVHIGPFFKSMIKGEDVGYLRGGTGWYRKRFELDETDAGKMVYLYFDGVQTEMTLWVNDQEVGSHYYGYSPFYFDITSFLKPVGEMNQLAIKVVNPEQNSRWFSGSGIYRQVSMAMVNPLHFDLWGVAVQTPKVSSEIATININASVINQSTEAAEMICKAQLISPSGEVIQLEDQTITIEANKQSAVTFLGEVKQPKLWDTKNPDLYIAQISIVKNKKEIDSYQTTFGIRSIEYSAEEGFLLNGKSVLLKGGCMHHDNGLLGSATFAKAEERRVRIMKENGFNAIRTSHNPPSTEFLNACDRLGMLVIDEFVDMWEKPKRPNDYSKAFKANWETDLASFVLRDRNHPSVVMWSYGNEIQERISPKGLTIAAKLIKKIKSIDNTRPTTQAICSFWDNKGKTWDDTPEAFALMDIGGYNYQWQQYEPDHEKYPKRLMVGTESVPKEALENWQLVEKHPYVIGDFVWTGMDYIGESGIGHSVYNKIGDKTENFSQPFPWYVSWCGDIDIIGNKKPQMFYRDVVWGNSNLEMAVHEPIPAGKHEMVFYWGWPLEYQSWNWAGEEGETLKVNIYSSYPKVRLELNGKVIGEQVIPENSITASFEVPYESGELKAIGLDADGTLKESKTLLTTGAASSLQLISESENVKADRGEIVYLKVSALDEGGHIVPTDSSQITVEVTGEAELLAAGNAKPLAQGSFKDNRFKLFEGKGLIILRSTGKKGDIIVTAQSNGLSMATIELDSK